jgi:menaquinone reductase, multiheme cytochrome c subunit
MPDYVFFNHAIHVNKGVGCETCHGRVDQMAQVRQAVSLTMSWCLDCHNQPERYLRPVDQVTVMGWHPSQGSQLSLGRELKRRYHVRELNTCTACHR